MTDWYLFDCPACEAAFEVDDPARGKLRMAGCPECGTSPTGAAFEPLESAPQVVK